MLQSRNPIDELLSLPDNELRGHLKQNKGFFPLWVSEYIDFILAGGHEQEESYRGRLH